MYGLRNFIEQYKMNFGQHNIFREIIYNLVDLKKVSLRRLFCTHCAAGKTGEMSKLLFELVVKFIGDYKLRVYYIT